MSASSVTHQQYATVARLATRPYGSTWGLPSELSIGPCDDVPMTRSLGLLERLRDGEVLILDGAIGTELQRRGVPMDSTAWCALAGKSHPELLRQIHIDYIDAGADIITTNTFPTARHVLEPAGLGDETEALNRGAVALARQAVEETAEQSVLIAGSMSSMRPLDSSQSTPRGESAAAGYREQAEILADAGADVLVAEMMVDVTNASLVIDAAKDVELPLMVGWSASPDGEGGVLTYRDDVYNQYQSRSFDELMILGAELGGDISGIMHSEVGVTGPALGILAEHWNGPMMAYAETGHFEPPNWVFTDEASPSQYAEAAGNWVGAGVQIVGGCCGTTPEHIAAIKSASLPGGTPNR